ncbi:MAG TPA: translocation/assembly module TamB domain-containing protein [Terriglobales bacterium]|nr:translocation/assembly module TamB domain-containing protein [Terriglobales bacterium]
MTWPRLSWSNTFKTLLMCALLLLLGFSVLLWYITTDSFQQMARNRVVAALERATGGKVELRSFHAVPLLRQVEVRDLTIHGKEASGEQPYVHVDSLIAVINLSSALGAKLAFHSLVLEHPVIHVIFYSDGSTNQPAPAQEGNAALQRLFAISARQLQVRKGELFWQDQRIPLDFTSNDVSTNLNYSFLHQRYSGDLAIGRAETRFDGFRPVAWTARSAFTFDRNGLQVQYLNAMAGRSQIHARGLHLDFRKLEAKGNYDLNIDLAETAAIAREPQVKTGSLHLTGSGSWSPRDFDSTGDFDVQAIAWQNKTFSGRDLSVRGKFSVDPRQLSISKTEGQFLRGSFTADADVVNWQAPANAVKSEQQRGVMVIKAKNLSLAELLSGLGSSFRSVSGLKFAGSVNGATEVQWKQSIEDAEARVVADVTPPNKVPHGRIPLTANTHATFDFRSGNVQLTELSAVTPSTQLSATGALTSSVKLSFSTNDLLEWQPVISQLFPSGLPLVVHGRAAFNGNVAGSSSDLRIAGNLQVRDFDTIVQTKAHEPKRQVHWDSLNSDVQASPTNLSLRNAILRREDATVRLNGTAALEDWAVVPESSLRIRLDVQNANADELSNFLGYDHEVSGKLSAVLQLSGTRQSPEGQGTISFLNGSIRGQPFDSANAMLALNGSQLTIKGLNLARGSARIAGNGDYDLKSRSFELKMRGTDFDLASFPLPQRMQSAIQGKVDFSAQAHGTTVAPELSADVHLRNLSVNGHMEGDFLLNAASHGADMHVTGHSEFKDASLEIDGSVHARDRWPASINFHFSHLDADPFLDSLLRKHVVRNSTVAGDIQVLGPLRDPEQMNVTGNLSDLYAEAGKAQFRSDGPIRFALSSRSFKLDAFHLVGENTDFSGAGSLKLSGDRTLDFQAHGKVDLKLLQSYDPDITSSGAITGEASVNGTLGAPLVNGALQVQNGAISDINLPSALSGINGTLRFNQNQVTIENLNAHVGGGTVAFTGRADIAGRLSSFELHATADSVRLRYPPGVSSTANAALNWSGSASGSTLSGDITVNKLGFTPGFDFAAYLERSAQVSSLPQTDPVLNKIRLDIRLATTPELQMQTSVIRLQGSADLRLRGSAAKPILLGRADVFEGEAYFNGTKYRLERGGISFTNPAVTTPFLDLEAVTRIRDYDVTLSLSGDISKPNGLKVNYRSDPPLPTADIIALLAFGQTTEESAQLQQTNQSAFNQQASSAMLAAALNATLNNRAQRLFGNSRIKIDPQGLSSETSTITQSGPALTIEQQVKDNLTLSYTTDVSQTSQQVIRAEYNLSKNVSIVAIRDQNGVVSFDVKIRRRKR